MLRVALFALPGPGDAILARINPVLLVRAAPSDFSDAQVPCVSADHPELESEIARTGAEIALVAGWEKKIHHSLYSGLKFGGWNIHPSLLPKYRGHNPYFHVLLNGETETGITVHRLTHRIDLGEMLMQKTLAISTDETIGSLWRKLSLLGAESAVESIALLEARGVNGSHIRPQPEGVFPKAPKIEPADMMLSGEMSVRHARNLIRACNPFYGAIATIHGLLVKIYESIPQKDPSSDSSVDAVDATASDGSISARAIEGGVTTSRHSNDGPIMRFRDGHLVFTALDVEGYGIISGSEFIRRFPRQDEAAPKSLLAETPPPDKPATSRSSLAGDQTS